MGLKTACLVIALALLPGGARSAEVRIVKTDNGWRLLRDGRPYFINGAGGTAHLDRLVAAGGNSIRTWSPSAAALDEAHKKNLTVMLGLPVRAARHGFDYFNAEQVAQQLERVRETVLKFKDHPALLMWGLGNELELDTSDEVRIKLWQTLNDMALAIKKIDPGHPTVVVLAGAGRGKLAELKQHGPAIDAVGINAYGGMLGVPEAVEKQGWDKPYIVTEFGPRGHWEVEKTPWGLPIEDTSTEKAEFYLRAYRHAIQDRPQCLGSYVFYWSQKQEKTHTWYGMFLPDGTALNPVDAISYAWTGKWPANRAPRTGRIVVSADTGAGNVFPPGARLRCTVTAEDLDGDPLKIVWDLRRDVSDAPQRGGDREEPTPPIEGAVLSAAGGEAAVRLPEAAGNYRIFVYAYDGKGSAATANVAVRVE